jgi:arabinofuranosyltransferase
VGPYEHCFRKHFAVITPEPPAAELTSGMATLSAPKRDRGFPGTTIATLTSAPGRHADGRPGAPEGASRLISLAVGLLTVLVFGVLAFEHRWISDDGMIVVREVRQILAGDGPNYNPYQRDEVGTSPTWAWLLAAVASLVRGDVAVDAVVFGLVLSVTGLALALLGSSRFHRQCGTTGVLLPVGALVPVAIGGFWQFATSGLETGLSIFWLGLVWRLLVSVTEKAGSGRLATVALILGLGPLVRPDFALATGVFGAALLLIARPGWWRGLSYAGIAGLLPVGYEIFRMGYYGLTVPMTALAKEAGSSLWTRGAGYLMDFVDTYLLWVPLLLIAVVSARLLNRTAIDRRRAILFTAPVLAGVLLSLYVVKVGGDYMHSRMWIPVTFALLLPVMTLPVSRVPRALPAGMALVAVWALIAGVYLRPPYHGQAFGPDGVVDERAFEAITYAGNPDLTTTESRLRKLKDPATLAGLLRRNHTLVMGSGAHAYGPPWTIPMSPAVADNSGYFTDNMGVAAAVMPLNGTVIDVNGLASPLAGHLVVQQRSRPGHEKWLPPAWVLGEYADPAAIRDMTDRKEVTKTQALAARHALSCAGLKELMDSVNQPMSFARFWRNLTGSLARTNLRIPGDPLVAEGLFCRQ